MTIIILIMIVLIIVIVVIIVVIIFNVIVIVIIIITIVTITIVELLVALLFHPGHLLRREVFGRIQRPAPRAAIGEGWAVASGRRGRMDRRSRRGPSAVARGAVEQQCAARGVPPPIGEAGRLIEQIRDDLERLHCRCELEAKA